VPLSDLPSLPDKLGPHRTEQASSHPHDILFDPRGRFIVVPDKGLDALFIYALDTAGGKLVAADPYAAKQDSDTIVTFRVDPGSGRLALTGHVVKVGSPVSIVFR
jgi:6-phosphogluconolactonase (cycloisomerase 2 family)